MRPPSIGLAVRPSTGDGRALVYDILRQDLGLVQVLLSGVRQGDAVSGLPVRMRMDPPRPKWALRTGWDTLQIWGQEVNPRSQLIVSAQIGPYRGPQGASSHVTEWRVVRYPGPAAVTRACRWVLARVQREHAALRVAEHVAGVVDEQQPGVPGADADYVGLEAVTDDGVFRAYLIPARGKVQATDELRARLHRRPQLVTG